MEKRRWVKINIGEVPLCMQPEFISTIGSASATILLSQLVKYYNVRVEEGDFDGEIIISRERLSRLTGLTVNIIRKAETDLINLGAIGITKRGMPATNHIKLFRTRIEDIYSSVNQ